MTTPRAAQEKPTSPRSEDEERTYTEDEYIDYGVIQYRRGSAQAKAEAAAATPSLDPDGSDSLTFYLHGALIAYPDDRTEAIMAGAREYILAIEREAHEEGMLRQLERHLAEEQNPGLSVMVGPAVATPSLDVIRANFAARLDRAWGGEQAAKALQMFDWAVDEGSATPEEPSDG